MTVLAVNSVIPWVHPSFRNQDSELRGDAGIWNIAGRLKNVGTGKKSNSDLCALAGRTGR